MADDDDGLRLETNHQRVEPRRDQLYLLKTRQRLQASSLSITLRRTGALVKANWLAMADVSLAASPSIEPTAMVSVIGRVKHR